MSAFALRKLLAYLWASPWTALGVLLGALGLLTGGRAQWRGGVLECSGGAVSWLLARCSLAGPLSGMTLGHTVLGVSAEELELVRAHELVHVRQYERWGPLFVPAYLFCSLMLLLRRRDWYHDNPFEREAFRRAPYGRR